MSRRPRKKKLAKVLCQNCGETYLVPQYRVGKTRFCSFECGGAFRFRQMHASRRKPASNDQMKVCSRCGQEKPHSEFYKRAKMADGLRADCKACCLIRNQAWVDRGNNRARKNEMDRVYHAGVAEETNREMRDLYTADPEPIRQKNRTWRAQNKDKVAKHNRRKRERHGDKLRAGRRADYRKNKGRYVAQARAREELIKRATPPWADLKAIEEFYIEAERLTRETGIKHHVDHFYPLQGKTMCGLHVEANLRVTTAVANLRKSNRIVEEVGDAMLGL